MNARVMKSIFWAAQVLAWTGPAFGWDLPTLAAATGHTAQADVPSVAHGAEAKGPAREPNATETAVATATEVERFRGPAYPEPRPRGIYGGSLWMTFHGLQWPYSPFVAGVPETQIGLSGYVWIDTGYERISRDNQAEQGIKYLLQQGRFVFRTTPTYSRPDGWFVQGQAEFVGNKDQTVAQPSVADIDDLWVRMGKWNVFDLQFGRYEAWELFHLGMGLDLNTLERLGATDTLASAPSIYGVTYAYYRPSGAGNVALHLYPTDYLRFELLGQVGNDVGLNALAGRPAAILDLGILRLKAGAEYKKAWAQNDGGLEKRDTRGYGGTVQVVLDPHVELGVNGAYGLVDHTDAIGNIDQPGSVTTTTVGGFANAHVYQDLILGVGYENTSQKDIHFDTAGRRGQFGHTQMFGAIQYILWKQLFFKVVVAYAKSDFDPTFTMNPAYSDKMVSGRLRVTYFF